MLAQRARVALARRPASPVVLALKILYPHPGKQTARARPSATRGAVFGSVPRIRAPTPTAIRRHVLGLWIQSQNRHRGNHSQSLGTRVLNSATRIFLWQRWQARAGGPAACSPVRQDCICEYRFVGSGRSSFVDYRGQSCGRTVTGSGSQLSRTTCLYRACLLRS